MSYLLKSRPVESVILVSRPGSAASVTLDVDSASLSVVMMTELTLVLYESRCSPPIMRAMLSSEVAVCFLDNVRLILREEDAGLLEMFSVDFDLSLLPNVYLCMYIT